MTNRESFEHYLGTDYPFIVSVDEEGGYVVEFPDLPGCITQVESIHEIPDAAQEVRMLWIETALEHGIAIPDPSTPPQYSGKFNVRLPRSLHKKLADRAADEGVSLNQYVMATLSAGAGETAVERRIKRLEALLQGISEQLEVDQQKLVSRS